MVEFFDKMAEESPRDQATVSKESLVIKQAVTHRASLCLMLKMMGCLVMGCLVMECLVMGCLVMGRLVIGTFSDWDI